MSTSSELRQRKPTQDEEIKEETLKAQAAQSAEKEKKKKSIITRTIWGFAMMGFFIAILLTDHMLVSLFVIVLQIIVFGEVIAIRFKEVKERNLIFFRTFHWFLLISTFFYVYGDFILFHFRNLIHVGSIDYLLRRHIFISFSLYVLAFLFFVGTLRKPYKYQLGQVAWTVLMLLNVVVQSHVILTNIYNGLIWFVFPCTLIICNDVTAYFWGLTMGRRFINKPLTSLSPNKTWEGFVGALFTTMIYAFIASRILSYFDWFICPKEYTESDMFGPLHCNPSPIFHATDYSLPNEIIFVLSKIGISKTTVNIMPIQLHAVIFSLFASLIAPFGGFFASAMKRAYGIKDFSTLFPGHGGMTDRMDCQFIMGLFVYVYHIAFIKNTYFDYNQIAFAAAQLASEDQLKLYNFLGKTLGKL